MMRGDECEEQLNQLEATVVLNSRKNKTAVLFTFQWLRFISAIPFYAKLLEFLKHFTPPPLPDDFFDSESEEAGPD